MTEHQDTDRSPPAPRSASAWLVALNDDPENAALRQAHAAWLDEDAAHRRDWQETLHVWAVLGDVLPASEAGAVAETPPAAREPRRVAAPRRAAPVHPMRKRRPALTGLVAGLAACIAALAWVAPWPLWTADHVTATGQVATVVLSDGTRVTLAPESALSFSAGGRERLAEVVQGGAFFEVTPDPARPFRVLADTVRTTVLGTAFEVRRDGEGVSVSVDHGRVQLDTVPAPGATPSPQAVLTAGQAARVTADGAVERQTVPDGLVAAWRTGRLSVRNMTVRQVAAILESYSKGWIVITDETLAEATVTGLFDLTDPAAALAAVAASRGASVRTVSPWLMVLSPGDKAPS